jgi:hypothetical protein
MGMDQNIPSFNFATSDNMLRFRYHPSPAVLSSGVTIVEKPRDVCGRPR